MTKREFEEKSFEDVMSQLNEELAEITTLSMLREFAKFNIYEGRYFVARHIIEALENGNEEYWWDYDYSMGTLDTPIPLTEKADVEYLIFD